MPQAARGPNRRTVLAGIGLSTIAAAIGIAPSAAAAPGLELRRSSFEALRGQRMTVADTDTVVILDAVEDLVGAPTGHELAFSLLFRPETGPALSQNTHTLVHGDHGATLFLVPVDRGAATRYQAVINQIHYLANGVAS